MQTANSNTKQCRQAVELNWSRAPVIVILSFFMLQLGLLSGCVSGTPEQHFQAGTAAFQRGDTATAVREFGKAIRLDKSFAPAYYNLGICYSTPKTRDKAIVQFARAIATDRQYTDAYIALGQSYMRADSMVEAVGILRTGLSQGLPPELFYANLGYCYLMQAQKDSAIGYYQKAIAINPFKDEYYFNVGYLMSSAQYSDSSIRYLRKARELADNPAQVSYLLGCRLLDKPGRTRRETAEGIELLRDYLANGDGEMMKTSKAREKLEQAGAKP